MPFGRFDEDIHPGLPEANPNARALGEFKVVDILRLVFMIWH